MRGLGLEVPHGEPAGSDNKAHDRPGEMAPAINRGTGSPKPFGSWGTELGCQGGAGRERRSEGTSAQAWQTAGRRGGGRGTSERPGELAGNGGTQAATARGAA